MKKLKIVQVGLGMMGQAWIENIKLCPRVELVGLVDTNSSVFQSLDIKNRSDHFIVGVDLINVLDKARPDAIINVSPPSAHYSITKTCLEKGIHVLGEKPMCSNLKEAIELIRLSKDHNLIFMINQNYRRDQGARMIKRVIEEGKIGNIKAIYADYFQNITVDSFRVELKHSVLTEMSIHHFDLVRFFTNSEACSVFCKEHILSNQQASGGLTVDSIFQLRNNFIFSYRASWDSIGFNTSLIGVWRIVGEKGSIYWDGISKPILGFGENDKVEVNIKDSSKDKLMINLEIFVESIERKVGHPDTWCGDNIKSLNMLLSAIQSAEEGQLVEIPSIEI